MGVVMSWKLSAVGISILALLMSAANAADLEPVRKAPVLREVAPQASGYVEVYGGWARSKESVTFCDTGLCESFTEKPHGWVLGGAGRGNYWFTPGFSTQVDVQAEGTSYRVSDGLSSGHISAHSYLVGGHASWRDSQRGLIGLFAAAGDAGGAFQPAVRHGLIGAEGQLYWNQFTLYLQGGYNTSIGSISSFGVDDITAWFVRATGRYFITPNVMLEGTVHYSNGTIGWGSLLGFGDQGYDTLLWQAKVEARLGPHPFSVFAKYQGSRTDYDTIRISSDITVDEKVTDHRFLFGLRLYMGENTLLSNDRKGATLDIIAPLADPTAPTMFVPSASGGNMIILPEE
jgi:hypothetical protein